MDRAGITSGNVTLHTLRHTALGRMIAGGYDDYTVMVISQLLKHFSRPAE